VSDCINEGRKSFTDYGIKCVAGTTLLQTFCEFVLGFTQRTTEFARMNLQVTAKATINTVTQWTITVGEKGMNGRERKKLGECAVCNSKNSLEYALCVCDK